MTARTAAGLLVLVVGAAIVAGLFVLGPPADERDRQLDARRVEDLAQLGRDAYRYQSRHGALPTSLAELAGDDGLALRRSDPETGETYGYRLMDARTIELCATFATASTEPPAREADNFWAHGRGRSCFTIAREDLERLSPVPPDRSPG